MQHYPSNRCGVPSTGSVCGKSSQPKIKHSQNLSIVHYDFPWFGSLHVKLLGMQKIDVFVYNPSEII